MTKSLLIPILFAFTAFAFGQVQTLPEVEIQGDAKIRLPLIKKPVTLEHIVSDADSLPSYYPSSLPESEYGRSLLFHPARKATLKARLSTDFGSEVAITWYPRLRHIPLLKFDAEIGIPGSKWLYQREELDLGIRLSPRLGFNAGGGYQYADTDYYRVHGLYMSLANRYDSLRIGSVKLANLNTEIGFDHLNQQIELDGLGGDHIYLRHKHRLKWDKHQLQSSFLLASNATGIALQYRPLYSIWKLPRLEYVMLTDFRHIIPSIAFSHRFDPGRNLILDVESSPYIETASQNERLKEYKWFALGTYNRVSSVPLNLNADIYYWVPSIQRLPHGRSIYSSRLGRIGISHTMRYILDAPTLDGGGYLRLPRVRYTDVFENISVLKFDYQLWGTDLSQSLQLNISHLPDQEMKAKPYTPLYTSRSELSRRVYDIDFKLGFVAEYFVKDHLGENLKPVTDLSLGGEYRVCKNGTVFTTLENIFGTPDHSYKGLPTKGRNLVAGFRYLLY
ncbi:MAG: hypothetical protein Q8J62_05760 [Candidatus Cloacimonadaceae bacterium]|nr:hypothetical protein [Candidatus Cloacimonadaceae bacterium]